MFVMFDYYNLTESKNMLRRYLDTNYDRNLQNINAELLYVATQRGSQILYYKKSHSFTLDIQEDKEYFLIF